MGAQTMSRNVIRIFALIAMALVIGFSPAAHILKQHLAEPRYDGWQARKMVLENLNAGDRLFFSNDRFLPPFLDLVADTYAGRASIRTYWIFPYLFIGQGPESRTVADFACHIWQEENGSIVWALSKEYLTDFDRQERTFRVTLGYWNRYEISFSYNEILYEFYDGLFARGQIESIRQLGDAANGGSDQLLYAKGSPPSQGFMKFGSSPDCPNV